MNTIAELRAKLLELNQAAQDIRAKAEAEDRELTDDEAHGIDVALREFDAVSAKVERLERLEAQTIGLSEPQPAASAQAQPAGQPRRVEIVEARGSNGFAHMGEFASAVFAACAPGGGQVDPRLVANQPTNVGTTLTPADGGYAVPPDFRDPIVDLLYGEESILPRTDQYQTAYNTLTFPTDSDTPWAAGGITANWTAEAAQIADSKPALGQKQLQLHKLAALVPVTDELLSDAPAMNAFITRKTPEVMLWELNSAFMTGDGSGKPRGALVGAGGIEVPRDTSGAILYEDVTAMWTRMPASWRQGAVWMAQPDVEDWLMAMAFLIKNVAGTENVAGQPVYIPGGNVAGSPFGTLLGRPVVFTEAAPAANAAGDLALVDWRRYATATKAGSGLRQDVSMHLYFDYDIMSFRFIFRVAGDLWHDAPITSPTGTDRSSVVKLAAGA